MPLQRPSDLSIGRSRLGLPIYFPSVSSVKTTIKPADYIAVLSALHAEQFLVSAFDIHFADADERKIISTKLSQAMHEGASVLIDSGNYESFWKEKNTSWLRDNYHAILAAINCTIAFSFDEQSPPEDFSDLVQLICEGYKQDQSVNSDIPIVPIIHGKSEMLPKICTHVADKTGVAMVAVPERCLGESVFERAQTISELRKALDVTGRYVALHLLGTGNPISIAIYTLSGADSYDGLEWCRTVVDHESATLFHFTQADFFQRQTEYGDMAIDFQLRTLAHNLAFYHKWMVLLSNSVHEGRGVEFCKLYFPDRIFSACADVLRWQV